MLLGIDVGTSGCKAVVYDQDGVVSGAGYAAYEMSRPGPGLVEQDPSVWWDAVVAAVREATSGPLGASVRGISVSSSNALVSLGVDQQPIRPAIMQLDQRAGTEATQLSRELGSEELLQRCGSPLVPGPTWLPSLRWLQRNEPEAMKRRPSLLFPGGWVTYQLTGESWTDYSRASTTLLFDQRKESWGSELTSAGGILEGQLPKLAHATGPAGVLRSPQALELGLPAGIPVAVGTMDSVAAALGAGALKPGDAVLVLGTTARIMAVTNEFKPHSSLICCPYVTAGSWLAMGVLWNAGTALRAIASQWSGHPDFARMDLEASRISLDGSAVRYDADSGVFHHGREEQSHAHSARAVIEGVIEGLAIKARLIQNHFHQPFSRIVIVGGGSRSKLLTGLVAERMNCETTICPDPAAEPRGAAIIAGVRAGLFDDAESAALSMSPVLSSAT